MDDARALEPILRRCEGGLVSPAVALMEMLIEVEDDKRVARVLQAWRGGSAKARELSSLLAANASGCARVATMLQSNVDSSRAMTSEEEGLAFCRSLFDWSVRQSEEASVALYSLGSPELLAAATDEIVQVFDAWGSLGARKRALDVGCGIGRMEQALAPRLASIRAIDVSPEMIEVARRRCKDLPNISLEVCSGRDLCLFADGSFEFVFAIDSFPYLVQSGVALARRHFAESARVLCPGGELVVLNFSYRSDLALDRRDVAQMSAEHGFELLANGETPFSLWNGAAFRMRRQQ